MDGERLAEIETSYIGPEDQGEVVNFDALEGPNITTLQRIEKELKVIGVALSKIANEREHSSDSAKA